MAHVEPIKTNGRAYNVSPAVFLAMPGFRQMHITFTLQTIWMAKCRIFLSSITTSRSIAVKWYLRVYWLLSLSIVDSFAEHRRFFCLESTLLLESTDEYLGQSINFISQRSLFLIATDSFSLHQLKLQTAWQKSYWIHIHRLQDPPVLLLTKRSCQRCRTQVFC